MCYSPGPPFEVMKNDKLFAGLFHFKGEVLSMTLTNQKQNLTEFIEQIISICLIQEMSSGFFRHLFLSVVCYTPMAAIPKELPVDRWVEEAQCGRWSASMPLGF